MTEKILTAADILGAEDITIEDVQVPEWSGIVRLKSMTALEVQNFLEKQEVNKIDKFHSAALLVSLCAVGPDGEQIFTSDDLVALRSKSFRAIMRLQKVAMKINGLDEEEDKVKNGSGGEESDDSSTA